MTLATLKPAESPRARVLLADDHQPTRALLRALLERAPDLEIVGEACDGREALELAVERNADIVLLDVRMPRLDGLSAAELLRTYRPGTRVVLHTAESESEIAQRAERLAIPLIRKGKIDQVLATLATLAKEPAPALSSRIIDAVVLAGVLVGRGDGIVVLGADRMVLFYDSGAAALLELEFPIPAAGLTLDALLAKGDENGTRLAHTLTDAFDARRSVTCDVGGEGVGEAHIGIAATPFFDAHGAVLGVAAQLTRVRAPKKTLVAA